jgi:DNA-binding GntR family transcriptional regulator
VEAHKKDKEINIKNRFLQNIYTNTQNNMLKSQYEMIQKLRDSILLNNMKKQYLDFKRENILRKKQN